MLTEKQIKAIEDLYGNCSKEYFSACGKRGIKIRDSGKTKEQISAEARARRIGWRKNKELDQLRIKNNI